MYSSTGLSASQASTFSCRSSIANTFLGSSEIASSIQVSADATPSPSLSLSSSRSTSHSTQYSLSSDYNASSIRSGINDGAFTYEEAKALEGDEAQKCMDSLFEVFQLVIYGYFEWLADVKFRSQRNKGGSNVRVGFGSFTVETD
jgi:hypothetical protein